MQLSTEDATVMKPTYTIEAAYLVTHWRVRVRTPAWLDVLEQVTEPA